MSIVKGMLSSLMLTLLVGLMACSTTKTSTSKTSAGPTSPSGYFFEVSAASDVVTVGNTSTITVRVFDSSGNGAGNVSVTFSGASTTGVVATDSNGFAAGSLTVVLGTNVITVQVEDTSQNIAVLGQ